MSNRQWNTVAATCVVVTLLYVAGSVGALFMDKVTFKEFTAAILPVLTAWGGYLAALLPKSDG